MKYVRSDCIKKILVPVPSNSQDMGVWVVVSLSVGGQLAQTHKLRVKPRDLFVQSTIVDGGGHFVVSTRPTIVVQRNPCCASLVGVRK